MGTILTSEDVYLAYLPLAHILELAIQTVLIYFGCQMGYGSPRTLIQYVTDCKGDLQALRPTVFCGVPQVWDTIKKTISHRLQSQNIIKRSVFWTAYYLKSIHIYNGLPTHLISDLIFKSIKDVTGGRLKMGICGGSPLNVNTQIFMSHILCPIYLGYGMTETVGMGSLLTPLIGWIPGVVGCVMPSVQMKLVKHEDMDSKQSSDPNVGEIYLRGPSIFNGYYKKPDLTKEAFEGEWFKTGDVGQVDPDFGVLKIIDRIKNLVKLSNGEYIAIEHLESVYKQSQLITNGMICADSHLKLPILVCTTSPQFDKMCEEHGVSKTEGFKSLHSQVLEALVKSGKEHGLKGTQLIGDVVMSDYEWTSENGMLTAAMKLQRRHIMEHYKDEIQSCYKRLGDE
eukprot:NODE_852_length_3540_cov_1.128742.p1 type:complete len:397 gc:universal NODE_852_length_3540_cov_1.128742:1269-2459(+)